MGINQKLLAALVAVRTEVLTSNYPVTGICNAVVDQMYECETEIYLLLKQAICKWPGFSGDLIYPVPCPEMRSDIAYDQSSGSSRRYWWMWVSPEYGMKRRELLDFLITYFEGEVNASS